jgi:hypothetical protein
VDQGAGCLSVAIGVSSRGKRGTRRGLGMWQGAFRSMLMIAG